MSFKIATDRLWAKRWLGDASPPEQAVLVGHLRTVYQAAKLILEQTGEDQLRAFALKPEDYLFRLKRLVEVAAAIHDLGKANDHFQDMICGIRRVPQAIRHEWLTYYLFTLPEWRGWLEAAFTECPYDTRIALWAVTGHHPAVNRASPPTEAEDGAGSEIHFLLAHDDFKEAVQWISSEFSLGDPPSGDNQNISLLSSQQQNLFTEILRNVAKDRCLWKSLGQHDHRLTAIVKACLIAADVAGSALPRVCDHSHMSHWLVNTLNVVPPKEDLQQIINERLQGRQLRLFQQAAAQARGRVCLIRAGCGTGKTTAAYLWAANRAAGKRVFFCYPTTATATEGFRDYLFDPELHRVKFGAGLFHSRAEVDLELLLQVEDEEPEDGRLRVESLLAWSTPIICCTVDTVLAILQNQPRGLYAWPALARSAFVFDEIHAYDPKLFGLLLEFLRTFSGAPVLLMTASLSSSQRDALDKCLQGLGESLEEIEGPRELECLPRYQLITGDPLTAVQQELERGGKVLWICNTVDRALKTFDTLRERGFNPLIYHSRFRYEDRVRRHEKLISEFRSESPVLAVCTQVAEISLDLSASLLITDLAPIPALIQRLGRLNRYAKCSGLGVFMVVPPKDEHGKLVENPYDRESFGDWVAASQTWLEELGKQPISQRDLIEAWHRVSTGPQRISQQPACWIDGGPTTCVDSVRQPTPGLTVILEGDVEEVIAGRKHPVQVAIPMPSPPFKDSKWKSWKRVKGFLVAPEKTIDYDPERGATWRKSE